MWVYVCGCTLIHHVYIYLILLRIDILMLFFRNGNTIRWRRRMHWTPHCHFHSLHPLGNICGLEYPFKMFDAIPILLFLWTNHYTGANRSRKLWQSFRYQRNTSLYYNGQYKIRFKMVGHAYVCFWLYFVTLLIVKLVKWVILFKRFCESSKDPHMRSVKH